MGVRERYACFRIRAGSWKKTAFEEVTEGMKGRTGYFRSVKVLPGYRLQIEMMTDSRIEFDFTSRLGTMRFGALRDETVFATASTDGDSILFHKDGGVKVKISVSEFTDLLLVDRTASQAGGDSGN